jgi:hypothetical protein
MNINVTNVEYAVIILRAYFAPFMIVPGIVTSILTIAVYARSPFGGSARIYWMAIATGDLVYLIFRASILNWLGDGLRYSTGELLYVYVDQINIPTCKATKVVGYLGESYSSWLLTYVSFEKALTMFFPSKTAILMNTKVACYVVISVLIFLACIIGVPCVIGATIFATRNTWSPAICAFDTANSDWISRTASRVTLVTVGVIDYLLPTVFLLTSSILISKKFLKKLREEQMAMEARSPGAAHDGGLEIHYNDPTVATYIAVLQAKSGFHLLVLLPASIVFCLRSASTSGTAVYMMSGPLIALVSVVITILPLTNFLLNVCGSTQFRSALFSMFGNRFKLRQMSRLMNAGTSSIDVRSTGV